MSFKLKIVTLACLSTLSAMAVADSSVTDSSVTASSVTVYGVIDLGILSETNASATAFGYLPNSHNTGSVVEMKDGGIGESYWGIKGSEDLGGGLKATFNLQGNIVANNGVGGGPNSYGTTSLFNQLANVGISGGFGKIELGRTVSPIYWAFASTDVCGGSYFGSSLTALVALNSATGSFTGGDSNAVIGTVYNDNAFVYTTPTINGITASFEYAMGGVAGNSSAMSQEAATIMYNSGDGLKLDALIYNGNDDGRGVPAAPNGTNTNRLVQVGAKYTWNAISTSAQYFKGTNPSNTGAGQNPPALGGAVTTGNVELYDLGLGYRVSEQTNITSGYYHIKDVNHSDNISDMVSIGVNYSLSKLTTLYLEGAEVKNVGNNMNQAPVYATPVTAGTFSGTAAGITSKAVMAGIRHSF